MKRLTIERNSWHRKVARYGGLQDYEDSTDLCNYLWAFFWGLVTPPLLVAGGVIAGAVMVLLPVLFLLVWVLTGQAVPLGPDLLGLAFWAVLAGFVLLSAANEKPEVVPGARLIAAGYRSWKEKTCVLIDLK